MVRLSIESSDTLHIQRQPSDSLTILADLRLLSDKAKAEGISNCPYCAIGHDQNAHRIWKLEEMDADHVTAWSKGGETTIDNCQMLCKTHNRSKGNR